MKADSIRRKLRDMGVPPERAQAIAQQYGDESGFPHPKSVIAKRIEQAARREKAEFERRKFRVWCASNGLPLPIAEYVIEGTEKAWRFDFAWLDEKVAVEKHGATWTNGRHNRGAGFREDRRKMNAAQRLGWVVLEIPTDELFTPATLELIRDALNRRAAAGPTEERL